jgi:hypothetical protein
VLERTAGGRRRGEGEDDLAFACRPPLQDAARAQQGHVLVQRRLAFAQGDGQLRQVEARRFGGFPGQAAQLDPGLQRGRR